MGANGKRSAAQEENISSGPIATEADDSESKKGASDWLQHPLTSAAKGAKQKTNVNRAGRWSGLVGHDGGTWRAKCLLRWYTV